MQHYWSLHPGNVAGSKTGMARHIVVADTDEAALAIARRGYRLWYASFMKLWLEHGSRPVASSTRPSSTGRRRRPHDLRFAGERARSAAGADR